MGILFWLLLGCSRMSVSQLTVVPSSSPVAQAISNLRDNARQRVGQLIGRVQRAGLDDPETLSLTSAMLLGERSGLHRETRRAYAETGTAHLLALSGLHLGILYGMFYLLFLRWTRFTRWRWHALPLLLLAIWGYTLLTGFPVSLVRASVMLTVLTIGSLAERNVPSIHSLSLAALIILLCWPAAIGDIGFMLSFTSVFFILMLYLPIERRYYKMFMGWGSVLKPIGITLAAQIGTAPLCLYFFHTLPLGAKAINLLLVPLTSGIIYLGFITLLFPFSILIAGLTLLLRAELGLVRWWSSLPYTALHDIYLPAWMAVLMYALLLCGVLRVNLWIDDDVFE
jgi:competence protein ComEC